MYYHGSMGRELSRARQEQLLAEANAERLARPIMEARSGARRERTRKTFAGIVAAMLHPVGRLAAARRAHWRGVQPA